MIPKRNILPQGQAIRRLPVRSPVMISPATLAKVAKVDDDLNFDVPTGQVLWKSGDEIKMSGIRYKCDLVTVCNARFRNVKNKSDVIHLSNCHDKK